jgi:ATP-dependent DNA helicase DinG
MSIEVTTHTVLRDLLRDRPEISQWNHYLTMARLVARALRLSKSTLIQTGVATHRSQGKYRLSYAIAALLWDRSVAIVMPVERQERFVTIDLPQYQRWLHTHKPAIVSQLPPAAPAGNELWITDPQSWLKWQLAQPAVAASLPTIIDGADDLENWAQELLTVTIAPEDWNNLQQSQTSNRWQRVIDLKVRLLESLWQRPIDPYNCYVLDPKERSLVESVRDVIDLNLAPTWQTFYQQLAVPTNRLVSATLDRTRGTFTLSIAPIDLAPALAPIWERQPTVFVTSAVDITAEAIGYRQELGLGEITSIKFSLVGTAATNEKNCHTDLFQLYIPRWMPMPNTSKFQPILVDEIQQLLHLVDGSPKFVVILVGDTPLQGQLAATLAAEWGSRVRVERTDLDRSNILVSGWEFWQKHQDDLPTPDLMIITTLPIPSLEDPLVAAKVSFYKQQKQDWFRLYLLPTGLRTLHRSIDPMRTSQGIVAIFDNRINQRSYGKQVLAALMPSARINYPDLSWLDR